MHLLVINLYECIWIASRTEVCLNSSFEGRFISIAAKSQQTNVYLITFISLIHSFVFFIKQIFCFLEVDFYASIGDKSLWMHMNRIKDWSLIEFVFRRTLYFDGSEKPTGYCLPILHFFSQRMVLKSIAWSSHVQFTWKVWCFRLLNVGRSYGYLSTDS